MNDLPTLHEAFAELERRADLLPARPAAPPSRSRRPLLMAASVVAVLALATGVALVTGRGAGHRDLPAGGPRSAATSVAPSAATSAVPSAATSAAPTVRPSISSGLRISVASTAPRGAGSGPRSAAQVASRLRLVLGGSATFTWSAPAGRRTPYIAGTLTNAKTHRQGGFDLQTVPGRPGDRATCEDPGTSHCTVRRLADGSSLSVGREATGGDVLYLVNLVRPDGLTLLMHVSTNSDPKGVGHELSSNPPLSTNQITALLRSPRW